MTLRVIDWAKIVFMLISAPFIILIIYMILSSSVYELEHIPYYFCAIILFFTWAIINNILGYSYKSNKKHFTYIWGFSLLRKTVNLRDITCYSLRGFDEYTTSDNGVGFRSFKLILQGPTQKYEMVFNREVMARRVLILVKKFVHNKMENAC